MDSSDQTTLDVPAARKPPLPLRLRLFLGVLAIYLPTLIGFFADCAHCRRVWLWLWPVVPGGVVVEWVRYLIPFDWPGETVARTSSALATMIILLGVVRAGRWGRGWLTASLFLAFLWSCFATVVTYSAIRA